MAQTTRILQSLPSETLPGGEGLQIIPTPFGTGGLVPVTPGTGTGDGETVTVLKDNVVVSIRRRINFITGANLTLAVVDDPPNTSADITISAAADNDFGNIFTNFESGVTGNPASANLSGVIRVGFGGTIQSVTMISTTLLGVAQATTAVVDIWKLAGAIPTVANTITAAAKPTLTAASFSTDVTLTGWTTAFSAGDVFIFHLDSNNTAEQIQCVLKVLKT
jgi:hypothetical protein